MTNQLTALIKAIAEMAPQTYERIHKVATNRTRHLTVVTEDLYQPHNGAAVIRSCECFGVQDLHVITTRNPFRVSEEIVAGADAWVDVHHHAGPEGATTTKAFQDLKKAGYTVAATTLRDGCIPISEIDLTQKTAIVFGTEMQGLTEEAHREADVFVRIPMYGFTQSFNISVSVALTLFELTTKLRASEIPWKIGDEEQAILTLKWLLNELSTEDRYHCLAEAQLSEDQLTQILQSTGPA